MGTCSINAGRSKLPGFVLTCSAASFLALVLAIPTLYRQWNNAQRVIVLNATPLAQPAIPMLVDSENPPEGADLATADVAAHELAEADPVPVPDGPTSGPDFTPTSKKTHGTRLGYELEHGPASAPDARDVKPVY